MIHLYEAEGGGWGGGGGFSALLVRASQFTLGLKYRLHLLPEWSAPFSNIIKRL